MFILLIVLFAASIILSLTVRNNVLKVVQTIGYITQGLGSRVWPVVRNTLAIMLIIWIAAWWYIGQISNSPGWTFFLMLVFPIWFLIIAFWPLTKVKYIRVFLRPAFMFASILLTPLVIYGLVNVGIGVWSPNIKSGLARWTNDKKGEIAYSLNKKSIQSEPESGIFAKITETTVIVNDNGEPIKEIECGTMIRVLDLQGKKASVENEGLALVMVQNKMGHYSNNLRGYVPARILDWNWKKEKEPEGMKRVNYIPAPAPVAYNLNPAPFSAPAPAYNPPAPKEPEHIGSHRWTIRWNSHPITVTMDVTSEKLHAEYSFTNGSRIVFNSTEVDGSTYTGKWTFYEKGNYRSAPFKITFDGDKFSGMMLDDSFTGYRA